MTQDVCGDVQVRCS